MEKEMFEFKELSTSFDLSVKQANTIQVLDNLKEVLLAMLGAIEVLRPDFESPAIETEDVFLTVKQVSEIFGISVITLYKIIKAGTLPVTKFGTKIRIKRKDIDIYLSSSRFGM
jgi:excisionase family DNA binding protein